jgi:uncharacterized SAM-dependent methyltransferase
MALANVTIHSSQFPENVRRELLRSLRTRQINHKFHYDTYKQAQKWLALHEAHSPSRTDRDCRRAYATAFRATAKAVAAQRVQLIGLCCGDGAKEARLVGSLQARKKLIDYVPCDSSLVLGLTAWQAAQPLLSANSCHPLICDMQTANDLPSVFERVKPPDSSARVIAFFGTLHNYAPDLIISRLTALLSRRDFLLVSTNLAPEDDYAQSLQRLRQQYDNAMTHAWLCTFLTDLGFSEGDGAPRTVLEQCPFGSGMQRIAVYFCFSRGCRIKVGGRNFRFRPGERILLFFSYRYTPSRVVRMFRQEGLNVVGQWVAASQEEGVFLCARL